MSQLGVMDLIGLAVHALGRNGLRTGLTGLGIFLGVAATSATLQVQHITSQRIQQRFAEREAPRVQAWVWRQGQLADLTAIQTELAGVASVSAAMGLGWSQQAIYQDRAVPVQGMAVSDTYFTTTGRQMVQGRYLNATDFADYRSVVVIDQTLAQQMFRDRDPIGTNIYLSGMAWQVVGVMEAKTTEQRGSGEQEGELVIPLSTQMALTGRQQVDHIFVRPEDLRDLERLEGQVKTLLQQRHPEYLQGIWAQFDAPRTATNVADIQADQETLATATRSLLGVGAIALAIAGVGIANITVASTLERTKEIGLRRAIGATQGDVLWQFVLESVVVSVVGGVIAIATIEGVTLGITRYEPFGLPAYEFNGRNAVLALGAAIAVGIGSSVAPALRASRLDPVKALRS
ncbi:ABC transporter permease [Spirulina major CS-329]|jgi:putative ABC transport system permease protein|uniref:ABC transporter permease n=1 Tax=Spirulina TaxID=1154 RepID=UPI00232C00A2|nr:MULTISPECIES: ABC transporter permease [Spirulina]MDB9494431.1 ABC transporter permease [Spirulina subsalsa CS-330]MDB9501558.1 ABC transporter permease [Spirulina major CS-329]